ncbi:MAG: (2Fe-2S)-binding protein, partial [Bdellovibrionales bacterium]
IKVIINTVDGPVSRILSLANSPNQDYLEFAVGVSNSNFKQAFKKLNSSNSIVIEKVNGGMAFQSHLPSVLIASGIGITPFRSMIQEAAEQNFKQPISLVYGNRNQIPFEIEFKKYSSMSGNFKVTHILSNASNEWTGLRGRIDANLLSEIVEQQSIQTQYYVVGSPEMVVSVQSSLLNLGVAKDSITIEAFTGNSESGKVTFVANDLNSNPNKMICFCHSVTEDQILDSIASGAKSIEDIQSQTLASTGCGNCSCNVKRILECNSKKQ